MIPRRIFQTFDHKSFEPAFQNIVDDWKRENENFEYVFHTDDDSKNFIKNNFSSNVYDAYTRIIPPALKADLWRYCVLYLYGGFYADIDTVCLGTLERFLSEDIEFVAAIDLNLGDLEYHNVCNTFIGSVPKHPILKKCIERIVLTIKKQEIPKENIMNFAGPGCLGISVNQYLNRPDKESMVGFQGSYSKVKLIKFEQHTEYIRDLKGKKVLQNRHGCPRLEELYHIECQKIKNYTVWGEFGFKNVPFNCIIKP